MDGEIQSYAWISSHRHQTLEHSSFSMSGGHTKEGELGGLHGSSTGHVLMALPSRLELLNCSELLDHVIPSVIFCLLAI